MTEGRISWAQYSLLQHMLGRLEGLGAALPETAAFYYYDTLGLLNGLADEIKPDAGETNCHASVRTGSQ